MEIESRNSFANREKILQKARKIEKSMILPTELSSNYILEELLGSGEFSIVRKVKEISTGICFAMKIIDRSLLSMKRQMSEIDILKRVKHENIVQTKEVYYTKKHVFIVMELVTGGELFDELVRRGSFSEKDTAHIVRQITLAMKYLHEMKIVHRDLKLENVLLSAPGSNLIKITDFGLARIISDESICITPCGTPVCVAPEVLACKGYSYEVDFWAIGVLIYVLLCGYPPFSKGLEEDNVALLYEQIMKGDYTFEDQYWGGISDSAKHLISHLLVVDPSKRFTADQILFHIWMIENCNSSGAFSRDSLSIEKKRYNAKRKFKSIVYSLGSFHPQYPNPNEKDIAEWKIAFQAANKGNSRISLSSLRALLNSIGLDNTFDVDIVDLSIDARKEIDFDTFCALVKKIPQRPSPDFMRETFQMIDKDADGQLSYEDLHLLLKEYVDQEQEQEILDYMEIESKVKLSFTDFERMTSVSELTEMQ